MIVQFMNSYPRTTADKYVIVSFVLKTLMSTKKLSLEHKVGKSRT